MDRAGSVLTSKACGNFHVKVICGAIWCHSTKTHYLARIIRVSQNKQGDNRDLILVVSGIQKKLCLPSFRLCSGLSVNERTHINFTIQMQIKRETLIIYSTLLHLERKLLDANSDEPSKDAIPNEYFTQRAV
jgi:hypothetical protein